MDSLLTGEKSFRRSNLFGPTRQSFGRYWVRASSRVRCRYRPCYKKRKIKSTFQCREWNSNQKKVFFWGCMSLRCLKSNVRRLPALIWNHRHRELIFKLIRGVFNQSLGGRRSKFEEFELFSDFFESVGFVFICFPAGDRLFVWFKESRQNKSAVMSGTFYT